MFVWCSRIGLAAIIVIAVSLLIARAQLTSGIAYETSRYLIISAWLIGRIAVPTFLVLDLSAHCVLACLAIHRGNGRAAVRIVGWTILADFSIFVLAVLAAMAMFKMS